MAGDLGATETLGRLTHLVSDRTGIARELSLADVEPGDPPVHIAMSRPARTCVLGQREALNEGMGASLNRELAMLKALAEGVERYCAVFQPTNLPLASWNDLGDAAVRPQAFALFSREQYGISDFPFAPFQPTTVVQWTKGRSIADGRDRLVPAQFVYLPSGRRPDEPPLWTAISTGLAAGTDEHAAICSGLREVLERDAFMLVWRHELPTPEIDLDGLPVGVEQRLCEALRSVGWQLRARLLTLDIEIPVVLVIAERVDGSRPYVALAAGTHSDPRLALRLALEEACLSVYGITRLVKRHGREMEIATTADFTTLTLQSVAYAVRRELTTTAEFLFGRSPVKLTLAALEERFAATSHSSAALVALLGRWARDAVVVNCTTADVHDIGITVVRVLVPGLRPLDHNAAIPHLGGVRWLRDTINLAPHPFP
jgi:ribosomal protein S12 methylthiotransferase accessory factor